MKQHEQGTVFVVSSMASAGICVSDIRSFIDEDRAWDYFSSMNAYNKRCWATHSEKPPKLISTKSYMRAKGIPE